MTISYTRLVDSIWRWKQIRENIEHTEVLTIGDRDLKSEILNKIDELIQYLEKLKEEYQKQGD